VGGFLPPAPAAAAAPDPAVVAQLAIAQMNLRAIDIGIVPENTPGSVGLVGLPVWMWVDQPGPSTYGPATATVSAGGVTVTATATVQRTVWNMGDGRSVTCTTAGTPYADSYGEQSSPDCGHRYRQTSSREPGGSYTVTATSYWTVNWSSGAANGTIPLQFTQATQIEVGELQVIVTD
jgi:hypothetical protein